MQGLRVARARAAGEHAVLIAEVRLGAAERAAEDVEPAVHDGNATAVAAAHHLALCVLLVAERVRAHMVVARARRAQLTTLLAAVGGFDKRVARA